ncbi:MAG: hypothetical protein IKS68_02495 [Mailhella sp.]|nr:hypothetical protein [Mailhella sp.]
MPCFYLSFSRGLENRIYDVFGVFSEPRGGCFYPDAFSLLFTAADMEDARGKVMKALPSPLGKYDRFLLLRVDPGSCYGEFSGLECRQWLEKHGI